jgi:putative N6-adenine-specific DNA methylase
LIQLSRVSFRSLSCQEPKFEAVVTCLPGLETILSQELQCLGIQHTRSKHMLGWALQNATLSDLYNCHLNLGTASRILLRCGSDFSARALGELQRKVQKEAASWDDWIDDGAAIEIHAKASKSRLFHTTAIAERVVEGIRSEIGRQPHTETTSEADAGSVPRDGPPVLHLHVFVFRDVVSIWLDTTSGSPLHQRGYRLQTAKAPLREDVSFALLYGAGWRPPRAAGSQMMTKPASISTKHLLDPFCGSGTIVIEAAAMANGIPPGRMRQAPFQGTHLHDTSRWHGLVHPYDLGAPRNSVRCVVHGSDRDKGAIAVARANARRAGVLDAIDLRHCAFSAHPYLESPEKAPKSLLIVTNPPFGRRITPGKTMAEGAQLGRIGGRRRTFSPLLPLLQRLSERAETLVSRPQCNATDISMVLLSDNEPLILRAFSRWQQDVVLQCSHGGIPVRGISIRYS